MRLGAFVEQERPRSAVVLRNLSVDARFGGLDRTDTRRTVETDHDFRAGSGGNAVAGGIDILDPAVERRTFDGKIC